MSFVKIICGVIIGVLLIIKLRGEGSPISIYLSLALSLFVIFYCVDKMTYVIDFFDDVTSKIGIETGYLEILLKIVGISYLSEFTSNICKETGCTAVAGQVEISGKLTILVLSMPVLFAIVDTITEVI